MLAIGALMACDGPRPPQCAPGACALSGVEPIAYAYLDEESGRRGHARELVLDGEIAFVADSNGLPSLQWDSSGALTLLQGIDPTRRVHCSSIALHAPSRTLLCTAGDAGGLIAVIDVRDPASPIARPWPRAEGSLPIAAVHDVAVGGDTAWLAATELGLLRATVGADGTPSAEEPTGIGTEVVQVEVMGDRLILLDRSEGLVVLDAASLQELGRASLGGPPLDLAIDGDRAVVSLGSEGVEVFRIDDAGQPARIAAVQPRCVAVAADLDGALLAVGCLSGVTLFDLSGGASRVFGFAPSRYGILDLAFAEYGLVVVDWVRVDVYAIDPSGAVVIPDAPRAMRLSPGADARIPLRNPGEEPLVVDWALHSGGARGATGALTIAPHGDATLELSAAALEAAGSTENRADVVFLRNGEELRPEDERQLAPQTRVWHRGPEDDPARGMVAIGDLFPTFQRSATGAGPATLPPGSASLVMFLTVDCFLQWPQLEDMAWAQANGTGQPAPTIFFLTTIDEDPFDPSWFMRNFDAEALLTVEWADYLRSVPGEESEANPVAGFESTFMMRMPGADFPHDYVIDEAGRVVDTSRVFRGRWRLGD